MSMFLRRTSARRFGVSLLVGMALSGCGLTVQQKVALDQFSTATRDVSVAAQTEFRKSRQDVVEMNRLRVELGDASVDVDALDSLLTLDRTRDRIAALQALEDYGLLLKKLVGAVTESELLEASHTFVGSLKQVKGVQLTSQEAEGIGRAVAAVGGVYVESKRAAAVRYVVDAVHTPVLTLIELVQKDFDPQSDFWSAGYRQTALALRGHAASIHVGMDDLASRQSVQRAKILAAENMKRLTAVSEHMTALTTTLREAQDTLHLVLTPSQLDVRNIELLAAQVREFKLVYGLLRNDGTH